MEAIVKKLESRLHEWNPETSKQVIDLVVEIIELADEGVLHVGRSREIEQEVIDILDNPSPRKALE